MMSGYVLEGLPFITYYPAIIITALIGGFWPGLVATLLSATIAWFAFIGPPFDFALNQAEVVSLLVFVAIAGINVIIVALLNAAVEKVVAQERNVRVLVESAPNGIVLVDARGTITLVNASTEKLFGYGRLELVGKSVDCLVPHRQTDQHRMVRESFQRRPEARAMGAGRDLTGRRKDGSEFAVEIGLNPIGQLGDGATLATVIDISERRQAQDRQHFLVRELQHRTQNLFSVIQSIASRSFAESHSIAEGMEVFNGRLGALARAHAMLAKAAWTGAPLVEILKREFTPFARHLIVHGCDIVVSTQAAQQFALIVHELATNAAKYGALSTPGGRVAVEGRIEQLNGEPLFSFRWRESGGPPVSAPTRRGFGSVILLDAARQFGQHAALNFEPEGLTYELQLPLRVIEASTAQQAAKVSGVRAG